MQKNIIRITKKNNPNNPYVKNVSVPRLRKFQNAYPELLKENH